MEPQAMTIDFTLDAPAVGFAVHVRMRRAGERWIARALARGVERVGLAESPRGALTAALAPLGSSAVTVLLADLGLLEPSVRLLEMQAAAR